MRLGLPGLGLHRLGAGLGPNVIVNGTFNTDLTGWTVVTGWTWDASGAAALTGDGTAQTLVQNGTILAGVTYEFSFTVSSISGGALGLFNNNGTTQIISTSTTGTFTTRFTTIDNKLQFKRTNNGVLVNAVIDNVTARRVG